VKQQPHWSLPFMLASVLTTLLWSLFGWWVQDRGPCQHYAVARTVYCTAYNVSHQCISFAKTPHEKMICVDDSWSWWSYEGQE
jgi:hypothetical protein